MEFAPGICIQWPWSQLIVQRSKSVETRNYDIPKKYLGEYLALIETPGPEGNAAGITEARIIALVKFGSTFRYSSKEQWLIDKDRHRVEPNDEHFGWTTTKQKWGWEIEDLVVFKCPLIAPKRKGIVFTRRCTLSKEPKM